MERSLRCHIRQQSRDRCSVCNRKSTDENHSLSMLASPQLKMSSCPPSRQLLSNSWNLEIICSLPCARMRPTQSWRLASSPLLNHRLASFSSSENPAAGTKDYNTNSRTYLSDFAHFCILMYLFCYISNIFSLWVIFLKK